MLIKTTGVAHALVVALASSAAGQDACFPSGDSNEAKTFAILSAPLAFGGAGNSLHRGMVLALEAVTLPVVPDETATPRACRPGKGPENTNPLPGVARLRVELGAGDWRFDAGWIPPVPVAGVRSNLLSLGIGHRIGIGSVWNALARAHVLLGAVRAPVTCNEEALDDETSECWNGTLSDDRWAPNIGGIELLISREGGGLVPHAGIGWSMLRPRFQVNFTNSLGETDRRRVEVDLTRVSLAAGVTARTAMLGITGEGYLTLGDRIAARLVVRLPLNGGES